MVEKDAHIFFYAYLSSEIFSYIYPTTDTTNPVQASQIVFYDSIQNRGTPAPLTPLATLSSLKHPIKRIHPPFTILSDHVYPFTGPKEKECESQRYIADQSKTKQKASPPRSEGFTEGDRAPRRRRSFSGALCQRHY